MSEKDEVIASALDDWSSQELADEAFYRRLSQEFQLWEEAHLVPPEVLSQLRLHYGFVAGMGLRGASSGQWLRWVIYAAVGAFLASFFTFAGSDATSLGPAVRVGVLAFASALCFVVGIFLHGRGVRRAEGDALLILGGLLLPVAFYFGVYHYELWQLSSPFVWWSALSGVLALVYVLLGVRFEEEGLAGVGLCALGSVPCLLAVHLGLGGPYWGLLLIALALCFHVVSRWPWGGRRGPAWWSKAFARPAWLVGYCLAIAASSLPLFAGSYARGWSILIYAMAAVYYVLQVQSHGNMRHLAPFLLNVFAGMGSLLQFFAIESDVYPLVFVVVFSGLVGTGLALLQERRDALELLLRTLLGCLFLCTTGLFFYRASAFRGAWLFYLTVACFGGVGVSLYVLAWRHELFRSSLSHLGAWFAWASWSLVWIEKFSTPGQLEWFGVPLGLLLLLNRRWFVAAAQSDKLLTLAVVALALPSLLYSWKEPGLLRTILLGLGGVGMIGWGAWREHQRMLLLGVLVLLPALFIKLLPGLAELGVPRFVWFAGFGGLLILVAWLLHKKGARAAGS